MRFFDLIGLPPTPEEIDAFLKDDRPERIREVVEDCWPRRTTASAGGGTGSTWHATVKTRPTHSSPGSIPTGFVIVTGWSEALNRDLPYDRFILEQIAGDLLDGPDRLDRLAALGFFACGPVYYGDSKKHDQYADRIDTLTRGFLGLTVACARCHDHKYDPIPTTDYYALAGVFASTEYVEVPAAPKEQVEAYDKAQAAIQAKDKEITSFLKAEAGD